MKRSISEVDLSVLDGLEMEEVFTYKRGKWTEAVDTEDLTFNDNENEPLSPSGTITASTPPTHKATNNPKQMHQTTLDLFGVSKAPVLKTDSPKKKSANIRKLTSIDSKRDNPSINTNEYTTSSSHITTISNRQSALTLADKMRPSTFEHFFGQSHLVSKGSLLRSLLEQHKIPSLILWGPPGTGKTTLANIIAHSTKCHFVKISAVESGLTVLKQACQEAEKRKKLLQSHTILFVDEIHRWNKLQQDSLLKYIEEGTVTLIGATTENVSFECNAALVSRCKVFVLNALSASDIEGILKRGVQELENAYSTTITIEDNVLSVMSHLSDGDARGALNSLEMAWLKALNDPEKSLKMDFVKESFQKNHLLYDKSGEEHYNIISALHKSLRGSDANAAAYWLMRMLESGEDPKYVARRMIRFASEDIGIADPQALVQAIAGFQAVERIGMPECGVCLLQVAVYLARAPKNVLVYKAYKSIQQAIRQLPTLPVPLHLRNAPTSLMKDLGYSEGYKYNPDYEGPVEQEYLPEALKGTVWLDMKDLPH